MAPSESRCEDAVRGNLRVRLARRMAAVAAIDRYFEAFNAERLKLRRTWCVRMLGADYEALNYFGLCDFVETKTIDEMILYY